MTTLQQYKELFSKCASLSPELKKKAKDELHETDEKSERMVTELRELIQENRESKDLGELVSDRFLKADYDTLLRFIRARKFDVTRAYDLLQGYVRYRKRYPALMDNLTLESIKPALLKGYPTLIPARTAEGYVVMMFSIGEWKPETCSIDDIMRACLFVLEMLLLNEATQIHGIVFIDNYNRFSFKQMFALTPQDMRKIVDMMQGSFPSRFKGVHVINQPWYFNIPFRIMKTFMNKKLSSRCIPLIHRLHCIHRTSDRIETYIRVTRETFKILIHGYNLESFKKYFDVDVLPKEYGGVGPDYDPKVLIQALEESCELDG